MTGLAAMLGGLKSLVPGLSRYRGTGGTDTAPYCYAVWLRHRHLVERAGLPTAPCTLVEIGPGDSLGVGLVALMTGTRGYVGLDVVPHVDVRRNLVLLGELAALLGNRAPIPGDDAFPLLYPRLDAYDFPATLAADPRLREGVTGPRLAELRAALQRLGAGGPGEPGTPAPGLSPIRYVCPWTDVALPAGQADMVLSQVALQDIEDLEGVFAAMRRWLRPGGVMSHQIDFAGPDPRQAWNAHWTVPRWQWRLMRGRRPWYPNGQPLSAYLQLLDRHGFALVGLTPVSDAGGVPRARLARRYRQVTDADLATRAAHLVAVRR